MVWLARNKSLIDGDMTRQAAANTHDVITNGKFRNMVSDRDHATGKLQTEKPASSIIRERLLGNHSHGQHQVLEVKTGSSNFNFDLIGLGRHASERSC